MRFPDLARTGLTNTARIARVAEVRFVLLFVAREDDFLGVDDNDVVAPDREQSRTPPHIYQQTRAQYHR